MNIEPIRRFARERLGYRSRPYLMARDALVAAEWLKREGVAGLQIMRQLRSRTSPEEITVDLRSLDHPFTLRPRTDDVSALVNNVIREEYGQLQPSFEPKTIIDAGAYIGDTSSYFLSRFPEAEVVALEPTAESWELAKRNLAPYGNRIHLLPAALSSHAGRVSISGTQMGARTESSETGVEAMTVPQLMKRYSFEHIDLLKMDIEGAEVEILDETCHTWIRNVKVLLLETHGPESERRVFQTIDRLGLKRRRFRNAWYITDSANEHWLRV